MDPTYTYEDLPALRQRYANMTDSTWDRFLEGMARRPGLVGSLAGMSPSPKAHLGEVIAGLERGQAAGAEAEQLNQKQALGALNIRGKEDDVLARGSTSRDTLAEALQLPEVATATGKNIFDAAGRAGQTQKLSNGVETYTTPNEMQIDNVNTAPAGSQFLRLPTGQTLVRGPRETLANALNAPEPAKAIEISPGGRNIGVDPKTGTLRWDVNNPKTSSLYATAAAAQQAITDENLGDTHEVKQEPTGWAVVPKTHGSGKEFDGSKLEQATDEDLQALVERGGNIGVAAAIERGRRAKTAPGGKRQGKKLDPSTAQQILQEAGGDKMKARSIALQRGYEL